MRRITYLSVFVLLWSVISSFGQFTGSRTYDFRDGTIISSGKTDDGTLTLSGGSYKLHGAQYGLNMKVGGEINITVGGSSSIRYLGSKYSGLNMVGTATIQGDLGTQNTKVTNDLVDTYDFIYAGGAATLNFKTTAGTGNDLYLPSIEVIPAQAGVDATAAVKNIVYGFDLRDGSIIPNQTSLNGNYTIEKGLFKIECGPSNGYGYNGAQHGSILKTGNKITLQVAGNSYIRIGGCQYSNGTITASSTSGRFDMASQSSKTAKCYHEDGTSVKFLYVGSAGTVVLDFTGTTYIPIIEVVPIPYEVALDSYVQKAGTITLNGATISLTSGATAAESATVAISEGIVLGATKSEAYVALDLGGKSIESLNPSITGAIDSVKVVEGKLEVIYADATSEPKTYTIRLFDNSYLHDSKTYDFRTGTIISNGKSNDSLLTLDGGSYSLHGDKYGLNMKVNGNINVTVTESSTFKFLGSAYSSLQLKGSAATDGDLGSKNTRVTNDLVDTYDFVYSGSGATANFKTVAGSGNDLYLPLVDVIPAQMGAAYTTAVTNVIYQFDLRDGTIIPTITDGKANIDKGLISVTPGSKNAYGYNGTDHGSILKEGNQIVLKVAGNSYIKIGGCQYSNGTISVSTTTGRFDKASQSSQTTKCYHQDGTTVDFLYVGTSGTVTLDFTGTNYIPMIEVVPVPFDVELDPWIQKTGTISLNGVTISYSAGENSTANATVTVSDGTVISATHEIASVRMPLNGKTLSSFTPTLSGDIASVNMVGDTLMITFAGTNSNPKGYKIVIADNSAVVKAEPGKTYTYDFANGSVLPQTSYTALRYITFVTSDGILSMNSNTENTKGQYGYHDAAHGGVFFPGNSMDIVVAGNATISFITCTYGVATDAVFQFTDSKGTVLGTCVATNIGKGDGAASSFTYTGEEGTITATLLSTGFATAEIYIHGIVVENAAKIESPTGKIDVWDFGGQLLDSTLYNNKLDEAVINSWYPPSVTAGSGGNVLPSFTAGVLSWIGGSNDRLRTTNTSLTRYDENIAGATDYSGRIYVNAAAATGRYLSLTLSEDDEVTVVTRTDAGGKVHFKYVPNPESQTDMVPVSDLVNLKFVAKAAGTYHIFDNTGKPSYFRVYRKDAEYITVNGHVDLTQAAGIPANYAIVFKNDAGKTWKATMSSDAFSVKLPVGYAYSLSLADANGYVISSTNNMTVSEATNQFDVTINRVALYTVSGTIYGLGNKINNLALDYSPEAGKIFKPVPVIDTNNSTYTVQLESNCAYTITASGVNDYRIPNNSISIGESNTTANVVFEAKPLYAVTINATGLNSEQLAKLNLTFSNLNESGYVYAFSSVNGITLRDGVYAISYSGLDEYPVEMGLTSNLKVNGIATSKELVFKVISNWSFDDKAITNGTTSYKGLLFSGNVANEAAKGHLTAKADATIKVPVNPGNIIRITYYYSAAFSIDGGTMITTATNSTSTFEYADYAYTGTSSGFVTITIGSAASTTYITDITVGKIVEYKPIIYVGANKEYKRINEALAAIGKMNRNNNERVTVMIDPGNYEEMLVISSPNVTLKNAAVSPSIELMNKGVDIAQGAVRITSYYGHGYNYYSMGNNQKWNADILRVNKDNGYLSYENKGSGTTNGSYWNATVVVSANGFEAEDIIFENSFNQYISKKESEDVVVMWESGNKGLRPTDYGNTNVQKRSFVERAAAIAITNNTDKTILKKCRVVGRQDSFFGGNNARVVVYKGAMMGAVDYLFGGMIAVFYKTDLVMNVSDDASDAAYLTAAQQSSGRGYLMYECTVRSAVPGTESASTYLAKPGYFGRPWQATTSEVVFYNTTIESTNFTGSEGKSMIAPAGWSSSLGGESKMMYEYGTIEKSGENNQSARVTWASRLTAPTLADGTAITTFNFTKGSDGWDPIPAIIEAEMKDGVFKPVATTSVNVFAYGNKIVVTNVVSHAKIGIYSVNGQLINAFEIDSDAEIKIERGLWIVRISTVEGQKAVKVLTR